LAQRRGGKSILERFRGLFGRNSGEKVGKRWGFNGGKEDLK